jgi:hypothetical protein
MQVKVTYNDKFGQNTMTHEQWSPSFLRLWLRTEGLTEVEIGQLHVGQPVTLNNEVGSTTYYLI